MTKKILVAMAALICGTMMATAQQVKEGRNQTFNIAMGNVSYTHHDEKLSANDAVGKVLTGVLTGKTSVEASNYETDVKSAIERGLSSAYRFRYKDQLLIEGDAAKEGSIVVDALITNIEARSDSRTWKDKDGKTKVDTWYKGYVEVILTLKDAKTDDVISTPTVRGQGSGNSSSSNAIKEAISHLSGQITNWLNKYKPLKANIIEGTAVKKDKQKEVYIDLGSSEGAFEGLHMGVYEVRTIEGREARSEIGKLKIEAGEGDDISRCKIQSGGKDIKKAIDAGTRLVVRSISR